MPSPALFALSSVSPPSPSSARSSLPALPRLPARPAAGRCPGWALFALLLLTLCCAPALPPMAQAGEKQAKATQRAVHREGSQIYLGQGRFGLKPTGWNVCRDMVKNLDLLQQSDASFNCELKFHPSMTQFSEPDWEELKIEDHWELVYAIERELFGGLGDRYPRIKEDSFVKWQEQYVRDMNNGYSWEQVGSNIKKRYLFRPSLRKTSVKFEQDGPLITVLSYSLFVDNEKICEENEKCFIYSDHRKIESCLDNVAYERKGYMKNVGKNWYIVIYYPDKNEIDGISPGDYDKDFISSSDPHELFLYKNRAFTMWRSVRELGIFNIRGDMESKHPFHFNNSCYIERVKHVPTKNRR